MRYGLLFTALTVLALSTSGLQAAEPEQLSYKEFLQKVEDGQVKSVSFEPFLLEGIYSQADAEVEFFCHYPIDAASDPLLTKLLEENQVTVVKPEPQEFDTAQAIRMAPGLLLLVVPSVLLVFVIIYVVKINRKIDQVVIR
ncbi:MAG: ATP-dependent metallopeptidase FtsH/Yme1/Tma family protein [Phycisphaerae bacterium]|nr:ATP-dependent metallopeptidase FtsH/Yme1/Tma family protein [Phycisphaerae bacterium]